MTPFFNLMLLTLKQNYKSVYIGYNRINDKHMLTFVYGLEGRGTVKNEVKDKESVLMRKNGGEGISERRVCVNRERR